MKHPQTLSYATPAEPRQSPTLGLASKWAFVSELAILLEIATGHGIVIVFIAAVAMPCIGIACGITGLFREPDERAAADGLLLNLSLVIAIGGLAIFLWIVSGNLRMMGC